MYVLSPDVGIGQSSSVILDQKTHIITTDNNVNNVSKSAPSILPWVPWQMWVLITYWKICPIANNSAAAMRYTTPSVSKKRALIYKDKHLRIGFFSPSTLRTSTVSKRKNPAKHISGHN